MVPKQVTVLEFFMTISAIKAVINPRGPTIALDFANCVLNLVENNFEGPGVLIFANYNNASSSVSRTKAELLKKIHEQTKYTVEIKSPQNEDNVCDNYDENISILQKDSFEARPLGVYFIIIVDAYENFPYLAGRLIRSRSWNPIAKFIVLLFNYATDKLNNQHVEKILTCFFKYNVINIVVVVPEANNIRNAIIYGWRPYNPPKYCGYFNETAQDRLFVENTCEKGAIKHKNGVFEDRIPSNLQGCVLHIIALERQPFVSSDVNDANIEKILINEVVKTYKLKTRYEIINTNRGEREWGNKREWNGALKELMMKKGQLLLGGIFPDNDVHEDFECSNQYIPDSYTWVVPRAYQSPPWLALAIIFNKFVWWSVIAGFLICAIFWRILGQLNEDSPRNRSLKHCFLNAWICSLGFCSYLRPTRPSLQIFYVCFNIYCILVVTGYQTKLIDVLKNPTFEYQIQTIEELVESGMKFGGFEELHDLFLNFSDPFDSFIYNNWVDVEDLTVALIDVTVHRNFSVLCSRLELAYVSAIVPELSDDFGNFRYYAFDMNIFSVSMEMVALRGFGYMDKISQGLRLFKQAGISEALKNRFYSFNTRRRAKLLRNLLREKPDINSLSLQHMQGGFLILTLGYLCGTLVFALEIISTTEFLRRKLTRHVNTSIIGLL